jgi:hypothetical protein
VAGMVIPTPATSTIAMAAQATAPKTASIGIRLLDVSADEQDNPRARIYIVDFLPVGSVIHRRIQVVNDSPSVTRVAVYPAAASISNGTFNVAPGRTPNDLTSWITLDPATLTLQPHSAAAVAVTIAVPRDASPGERYAGIWAATASASARHGRTVVEVNRVGIRVYLAVGKGGPPPSNFVISSLTARRQPDGQPAVTAQVRNTGGRALDLSGVLTLAQGPGGLSAGPFPVQLGTTIAPGQSEPVSVIFNRQLPDGPWQALIHLKSGLTGRTGHGTITFPRSADAAALRTALLPPATAASRPYVIWAAVLALMFLAALAFVLLRRNWRSSRT